MPAPAQAKTVGTRLPAGAVTGTDACTGDACTDDVEADRCACAGAAVSGTDA